MQQHRTTSPLRDRLLGPDPAMRSLLGMTLISITTYLLYLGIAGVQVLLGTIAPRWYGWAFATSMGFNAVVFALIRSGLTRGWRDPALGTVQLVAGVVFMLLTYALSGPAAATTLIILASHLVYAMFSLRPRQVWWLVGGTLAALAATMLACHLWDRARFAPEVQVIGLLYASLVLPLIGLLANRITGMSDRLRSQKSQLQQAMQQLSELATRDELTRTHNRRHMTELMDLQLQQHRRQRLPMCLALLDIDWFKSINDQHGHATGDQVLQRFAAVLQDSLRAGDLLARWGGEEFLLLMPATDAAAGHHALQRLHARVATMQLDGHASELQVTFSAGVAQVDLNAPLEHSLERADQAMYRAKTRGRNRTEVAPDMPGQDQLSPAPRRAPLAEAGEALSAGRRETSPSPP